MAKLIDITGRQPHSADGDPLRPAKEVVEMLEHLLDRARAGEIRAVGIACVLLDSAVSTSYVRSKGANGHELMAAIAYLHHRYASADDNEK